MTCSKWEVFTAGLGEGVVARGGVDERGLIFKPTYAAGKGMVGGGGCAQTAQSCSSSNTCLLSRPFKRTHFTPRQVTMQTDKNSLQPLALFCARRICIGDETWRIKLGERGDAPLKGEINAVRFRYYR